ncbi:nucleoside triphosphate pyrophosphohydrolase family protein [Ectopseudomonas mendocina]|uniref:hypothetical protein n=1 Tax=Ectopseudomonas mendocina TaxID=300 RepID=UPI000F7053EB|nr:hypothetical protein [Pseudomonas mendocina]VEE14821.1 Uncharacterised protein [Pseudomonas mendocina]
MKSLEVKPSSIKEYQDYISNLYGEVNDRHSMEYVFSYLFRNAAYLSRVIGEKGESKDNFIKTYSWLFALSSKLKIDLEDAFLKKYPDVCPYCLVKPCICIKTGKKPVDYVPEWKASEEIQSKYRIAKLSSPKLMLDKAVERINDLYPANKHIWNAAGPTFQFYRVLEELGEVHEAYTGFAKGVRKSENIGEELADVFAWLLSTWGIVYPKLSLNDEFIGYYYDGCPVCSNSTCKCPDHSDRGERLVEIEELEKFRAKIEELILLVPAYKDKLDLVVGSLDSAKESRSTTSAVRTINQAKMVLDDINGAVGSVDETGRKISSIVTMLTSMAEKFGWM